MNSQILKLMPLVCICFIYATLGCGGGGGDTPSANIPPVADAGADRVVAQGAEVSLDGSSSSDPDGSIVSYQWLQTQGPPVNLSGVNSVSASFLAPETGDRVDLDFQLTVQDDVGEERSDTVTVTITLNRLPVADAGVGQIVAQGAEVVLDGSSSSDPDGSIVSYQWLQTQGPPVNLSGVNSVSASFLAPEPGVREDLVFQLVVHDNEGAQSSDTVQVTVNIRPVADAGQDQFIYASSPVTLTGLFSDSDGTVAEHQWTQIAGPAVDLAGAQTSISTFIPSVETASYTFNYTVTDNDGAQRSDMVSVYASKILFSDFFDDVSSESSWKVLDDSGNLSDWEVLPGEFHQQNNVHNLAFQGSSSYHTGTFVYLDDPAFTEGTAFRFSVDVTPQTNANGDREGNDVGIMFPYAAENDYYRLSMNSRYGFTRLEKRQGTTFRTLAVNSIGYVDDETVTITVEVDGDTIIVMIDDEPVFARSGLAVSPGTVALYCQDRASFDNVVISEKSPQPMVAVSSPVAHSIALTPGDGDALSVQAVVLNKPVDGSVVFALDGGVEIDSTASGNLYTGQFPAVDDGEHDVAAIIRDADGNEVTRDTNFVAGTGGNYIVAVGDSITNGVGDENPLNNDSADGRIVSRQGFQAKLADDRTLSSGLPQIVFNEGIPGEVSSVLEDRIVSILERHPGAGTMLLLIGTNDTWTTSADDFENNVAAIVNTALADPAVDRVYIAQIPPRYDNTSLNSRITEYNTRIEQITADPSDDIFPGPNFYELFKDKDTLYDTDLLHPNDAGYQAMAGAWHDVLSSTP